MLKRAVACCLALVASAPAFAAPPSLAQCEQPVHSAEALRYRLEGSTTLGFTRTASGKPVTAVVRNSSGWKLLDDDALKLLATCRFDNPSKEEKEQLKVDTLVVPWTLPVQTDAPSAPVLGAGSCPASPVLRVAREGEAGAVRARLLVWTDGQVYGPKIDFGSGDALTDGLMMAFVQACHFSPGQRAGVAVTTPATLLVTTREDVLGEPALRALYERLLPLLKTRRSGDTEYKLAHIMAESEAVARTVLTNLAAGATFADQAVHYSKDRKGKDGGDLGWNLPEHFDPAFAAALRTAGKPGLVAEPVKTAFGWHVIRVDALRQAEVPPFEDMRAALRKLVLQGRVEQVVKSLSAPVKPK